MLNKPKLLLKGISVKTTELKITRRISNYIVNYNFATKMV